MSLITNYFDKIKLERVQRQMAWSLQSEFKGESFDYVLEKVKEMYL